MRQVVIIIAGIVVLAGLFLFATGKKSPFGKENSSISVPEGREIDRIVMKQGDRSLELRRDGDRLWTINGEGEARRTAIDFIIRTLYRLEIKSPVSNEFFSENITQRGILPVEVNVYNGHKHLTSFLVYRFSDDPDGNIIKKSPRSTPFITRIPGYDLNPGSHFIVDPRFWMPYHIFRLNPANVRSVTLTRNSSSIPVISISKEAGGYRLMIGESVEESADTSALERYLSYFTFVPFESWAFDLDDKERMEIAGRVPWAVISLRMEDETGISLMLWKRFMPVSDGIVEDTDRLWGSINNGEDIFIVKYWDIDPLVKSPDYFISD